MAKKKSDMRRTLGKKIKNLNISDLDSSSTVFNKLNVINTFIRDYIPNSLFRMRAYNDNNLDSLRKGTIYLSRPNNFNDPFDTNPYYDTNEIWKRVKSGLSVEAFQNLIEIGNLPEEIVKELIKRDDLFLFKYEVSKMANQVNITHDLMLKNKDKFFEKVEQAFGDVLSEINSSTQIACFTDKISSINMWGLYGDEHRGFALEYKFPKSYYGINIENSDINNVVATTSLLPVVYKNTRLDLTDYIERLLLQKCSSDILINSSDYLAKIKASIYKDITWQHENEWRLIYSNEDIYNPQRKHDINPYSYKASAIYLGAKMELTNKLKLLQIAKEINIPVYDMINKYNVTSYDMDYEEVNIDKSLAESDIIYLADNTEDVA